MLIYLASSFKHSEKVAKVAKALESAGHVITMKWWDRSFNVEGEGTVHTQILKTRYEELSPEEFYDKQTTDEAFMTDFLAVKKAEALVFVAGDEPRKYNGAAVELGIALSDFKPCYLLGVLETSVMYAPLKRCEDVVQLVVELGKHSLMMRNNPIHPVKEAVES